MKKGALITSIAMVMVTVLALTVVSFAWFSASLNPVVGDFNVQVTTSDALLISAKADAGFKTTLPYAELTAVNENLFPKAATDDANAFGQVLNTATPKFSAPPKGTSFLTNSPFTASSNTLNFMVAKAASVGSFGAADSFYGVGATGKDYVDVATNGNQTADDDTVAGADAGTKASPEDIRFVKFDLFFKSTVVSYETVDVKLDLTTLANAADVTTYAGTSFKYTGKTDGVSGWTSEIGKIIRVAFATVKMDGTDPAAGAAYAYKSYEADGATLADLTNAVESHDTKGLYTTDAQGSVYTAAYNKVLTKVVGATAVAAAAADGITGDVTTMARSDLWAAMIAEPDKKVNLTIDGTAADVSFNSLMQAEKPDSGADLTLFQIKSGEVYRTTVYMWLEGNDAESNNFVSGGLFSSAFNFKGAEHTNP